MSLFEKLAGVVPPLVTPLDRDGNVDENALRKLVSRAIDGGVNGVVVLGTTGEGPMIERAERYRAIEIAVDESAGRVPVIAGTGDVNSEAVKENNRQAAAAGAFCSLVIPPFYFPQNQQAMIAFFKDIAQTGPLPVILYNFPQISKIYLEPETVGILSKEERIVGVKDSSANFLNFQQCIQYQNDSFVVYQGVGALTTASLLLGCGGFISPVANVDPSIEVSLYQAVQRGDRETAIRLQEQVTRIIGLWRNNPVAPVPSIIKALLGLRNICDTYPCSPNPRLEGEGLELLKKRLKELDDGAALTA